MAFCLCVAFMLIACGGNPQELSPGNYTHTQEPRTERMDVGIQIAVVNDEILNTFDHIYEFDYTVLRRARDMGDVENLNGDTLAIWADTPLRHFEVMAVAPDSINDEFVFIPLETFGLVEELLPGQAFVIHSYVGLGTMPASGFTFMDENGETRYFAMIHDESGSIEPNIFDPNINILDLFENGRLEIAVTSQSAYIETRYITLVTDENGNFDPQTWFQENRHLWAAIIIYEITDQISK